MNAEPTQATPGESGKPKLLIVEDDPALGRSIQRGTRAYFDVVMTTSVDAAFDVIDNQVEIAAAVVDINLPDGTGFDVVETLRQKDRNLPVLILTGSNDPATINRAHSLRVEFVCKPFFSENLSAFVQRTLSGSQYGDREKLAVVVTDVTTEYKLSLRESQILAFASEGIPRSRLSDVMGISENTVKSQVRSLLEKLEKHALADVVWWVRNRAGL
ncbi:MAG: response regulator transcription factor [Kofleriaceae bacterium]